MFITIVPVPAAEAWPCELCDENDVVAYISVEGAEATSGYCQRCLPAAVMAELEGVR